MHITALALMLIAGLGASALANDQSPRSARPACGMATPTTIDIAWPSRIAMSGQSATNFERFNPDGHGSLLVITHYDGSIKTIIPPTQDIDDNLHAVLEAFAHNVILTPTVACGAPAGLFLVRFDVPSGRISHVQLHANQPADLSEVR